MTTTHHPSLFDAADLVAVITWRDLIAAGDLVDVTATAAEAGFRHPVALTRAAWDYAVAVPAGATCQDEAGRLWDVLFVAAWAARHATSPGATARPYSITAVTRPAGGRLCRRRVALVAECAPGSPAGEPVVTIRLAEEG